MADGHPHPTDTLTTTPAGRVRCTRGGSSRFRFRRMNISLRCCACRTKPLAGWIGTAGRGLALVQLVAAPPARSAALDRGRSRTVATELAGARQCGSDRSGTGGLRRRSPGQSLRRCGVDVQDRHAPGTGGNLATAGRPQEENGRQIDKRLPTPFLPGREFQVWRERCFQTGRQNRRRSW